MACEARSDIESENDRLVGLIMAGDRRAADLLFAFYMPQLRKTASWMFPNSDDSEDALQDGLLLAFRNLNQFQGRAKFSTWLHRIVVNAALMRMRRQRSRPTTSIDQAASEDALSIADLLVDPQPNPEQKYMAEERSRILAHLLEDIPTTSRMVVRLVDIDGVPGRVAAQRLGITLSALKARHHRARRTIIRKMKEPQKNAQQLK